MDSNLVDKEHGLSMKSFVAKVDSWKSKKASVHAS